LLLFGMLMVFVCTISYSQKLTLGTLWRF
jgi:hypothetical protein